MKTSFRYYRIAAAGFFFAALFIGIHSGWAVELEEIPGECPNDDIMASTAEVQQVWDWAKLAFGGEKPATAGSAVAITVRRQDFNVLRFGESCMETPIAIGKQSFQHGLGTHANSEIAVTLPDGAKIFKAFVGIDNNYNTQGIRGSAEFSVEINGKELYRSSVLKGGNDPVPVSVDIPADAKEIVLKVGTTADGPSHDQSDWADAQLVMADGRAIWLDENQNKSFLADADVPFSFVYDGVSSREFLKDWTRTVETIPSGDKVLYRYRWDDPNTALQVQADVTLFQAYPAVDWVLYFDNQNDQDSPILENIQAVDLNYNTGSSKKDAVLHQLEGDACGEKSFSPFETTLEEGEPYSLKPTGGRSSNTTAFPFFNLQYGSQGTVMAIGWTGQWSAGFERAKNGTTRFQAGMERTHLSLLLGEKIRTPRILLMPWRGEMQTASIRFRRLLMFEYAPRLDGKPIRMPIALQTFDRYVGTRPEWATEAGQVDAVKNANELGCDTYWLDAAWFPGNFPDGVGNWECKPKEFPNGLKPISDACHEKNMRFVVWFEPERVAAGTRIAREHPEFVFGGEKGGLFKLSDPAARRWLTDLLIQRIREFGLDVYRNDFNMDPLNYWRDNDAPNRQGITEIRYVDGLYTMWDEIRSAFPHLFIDNCSSGGRRIDLEMCMRSVPLWRSDTSCSPGHPDWNQVQTVGLGRYVPLFTACGWTPEPYDLRSSATTGALCQWAYLDKDFPFDLAKETLREVKENQKFWYGDLYPLTASSSAPEQWMAYQFHRSDLNAGLVYVFRHIHSPYTGLLVSLKAVNPDRTYAVTIIGDERKPETKKMTGQELMKGLEFRVDKPYSSFLIRYTAE